MIYTVESFSWGNALFDPDIQKIDAETLETAKKELGQQWQNPRCFHVRVLSSVDPTDRLNFERRLHYMKSRPTRDRELHQSFEKIIVPDGVRSIRPGETANVLRACDFLTETPTTRLLLPAREFFANICETGLRKIEPKKCLDGSKALRLENFETCLAAAAFTPASMNALVGENEDYWYYLSEIDIDKCRAELSFSMMEAGTDFVQ